MLMQEILATEHLLPIKGAYKVQVVAPLCERLAYIFGLHLAIVHAPILYGKCSTWRGPYEPRRIKAVDQFPGLFSIGSAVEVPGLTIGLQCPNVK